LRSVPLVSRLLAVPMGRVRDQLFKPTTKDTLIVRTSSPR
jgi:hypothetical protein